MKQVYIRKDVVLALIALALLSIIALLDLPGSVSATGKSSGHKTAESSRRASNKEDQTGSPVEPDTSRWPADDRTLLFSGGPRVDSATYMELRDQQIRLWRGLSPDGAPEPGVRDAAIKLMERQETVADQATISSSNSLQTASAANWIELGPAPLPNGETQQAGVTAAMTGRATAVVIDPTNSNKVYLGTAQGGVWRSVDAGAHWTSIFDTAQSLAIGALALAPSSPTTLYVGTGESDGRLIGTADGFFGVGVYRIDNADSHSHPGWPHQSSILRGPGHADDVLHRTRNT